MLSGPRTPSIPPLVIRLDWEWSWDSSVSCRPLLSPSGSGIRVFDGCDDLADIKTNRCFKRLFVYTLTSFLIPLFTDKRVEYFNRSVALLPLPFVQVLYSLPSLS